jgi:hypothetical protein
MANATMAGWKQGTVTGIKTIMGKTGRLIRITVDVPTKTGVREASAVCPPTLVPGGSLYRWIRVCGIPLAEIDSCLRPELFIGKPVKVRVAQNGEYLNITDYKI